MSVAAVIPTYNRRYELERCLRALAAQTHPLGSVYVVDNASTDGTGHMIRSSWSHFVEYRCLQENGGAAKGFEDGIRWATEAGHEWIWMTDNDSIPCENSLERLLAVASVKQDLAALIPKKETSAGEFWCGEVTLGGPGTGPQNPPLRWYDGLEPFDCDWAPNTGMLIRREAVLQVGFPMAEIYAWGEDTEYCLRLRKFGRIMVVPDSVVVHPNPTIGWPVPYHSLWKLYYVHRNEVYLRMRGLKPPKRSLVRTLRDCVLAATAILQTQDHKHERLRTYLVATWHGITGRLGRGPRWVHH